MFRSNRRSRISGAGLSGAGLPACARAEGASRIARKPAILLILLALALAALTYAQTASEKPSGDTRRVGSRMACQCNGCKDSVATCSMLECSFSKPAKERIAKMQAVGMTDQQIIEAFMRDYGPGIYLAPPNLFGILVPYLAVGMGIGLIWWFIRRYRPQRPLPELGAMELDDPALAKYKDQIEKDLANLE